MKKQFALAVLAATVISASGCAQMTEREQNTAIGAAVGGIAGAVITNGSVLGTATGAVVGGIIGNEVRR